MIANERTKQKSPPPDRVLCAGLSRLRPTVPDH